MISPVSTAATTGTASQVGPPALGKNDFLKLLITQLRNQDPLNPLDQNQFLAQTAQFTSLEHLQNINAQLADVARLSQGATFAQSASLLGKTALAGGRDVVLGTGPVPLTFALDRDGSAQITVTDAQNTVVRQLSSGPLAAGAQAVTWDGRDSAGQFLTAGVYHYRVTGNAGVGAVAAYGTLSGMTPTSTGVVYQLGGATVRPDDLISVG